MICTEIRLILSEVIMKSRVQRSYLALSLRDKYICCSITSGNDNSVFISDFCGSETKIDQMKTGKGNGQIANI